MEYRNSTVQEQTEEEQLAEKAEEGRRGSEEAGEGLLRQQATVSRWGGGDAGNRNSTST